MKKELIGDYGMSNICYHTGKVMFTKRGAGEQISMQKRHNTYAHYGKNNSKAKRSYCCEYCGWYHVTHLAKVSKKKGPLKEIYKY